MQAHIIDGFTPGTEGDLVSVFGDRILDAVLEQQDQKRFSCEGYEYPISLDLAWMINRMPDLVDWIISSILTDGKNLVIFSTWEADTPSRS